MGLHIMYQNRFHFKEGKVLKVQNFLFKIFDETLSILVFWICIVFISFLN